MGNSLLPYVVQETHYTGLNMGYWLYLANQIAMVFLILVISICFSSQS